MKTTQRMKTTQMPTLSAACIASEYCSPNKAASGDFVFLTLRAFVHSLRFVPCVVFTSLIKHFHAFNAISLGSGAAVLVLASRNDSLALKLFGY